MRGYLVNVRYKNIIRKFKTVISKYVDLLNAGIFVVSKRYFFPLKVIDYKILP